MKIPNFSVSLAALCALSLGACAQTQTASPLPTRHVQIHADLSGPRISPLLYGLMTEEINFSYEGGLYAELIRNRVFKDAPTPVHWSLVQGQGAAGTMALDATQPVPDTALTTALRLDITQAANSARVGAANEGFWGIPVTPQTTYRASFYAKSSAASGPLTLSIESNDGQKTFARAVVRGVGAGWKQFDVLLRTGKVAASKTNRFVISSQTPGTIWLNQVSLFPPTYKNRPNGLRIDLMEKMRAMKPSFLRFPGGNYLEGQTIAERFDWKKTIGPISQRPGHRGPWGYRSSDGMGMPEFLSWCQDLNVEPVLGVFAGYALGGEYVTGAALEPFVQDALDEVEYITGDKNTQWGAQRIKDGFPKPFPLRYVEIGNEDWFDRSGSYETRFAQFYDAFKRKYPQIQLVASTTVRSRVPDVLDEHLYASSAEMMRRSRDYDRTPRTGPKIFVGEWAAQDVASPWINPGTKGPTPSHNSALGDAAYMTGLERNSDHVIMQCYAPLFVNVNPGGRQWAVNLIGYDALGSFASPSYYAQAMFAHYRGDTVVPLQMDAAPTAPVATALRGRVGVGAWNTQAQFKDFRVSSRDGSGEKLLYSGVSAAGVPQWEFRNGQWSNEAGTITQTGNATRSLAFLGDASWGDVTYELQARKTGGAEGFLIPFRVRSNDDLVWLNLGGWGNTLHGLQKMEAGRQVTLGERVAGRIESDRWYRIKIEMQGQRIRAYLDDQLVMEARDVLPAEETLFTTASREDKTGDLLLKIVNASAQAQRLRLDFGGVGFVPVATGQILSGAPGDINTLESPLRVAPRPFSLRASASRFEPEIPAHSISVLRFKSR